MTVPSTRIHSAQRGQQRFGLARAVELQVDHDVVWVVGGPQDPVAAHARFLPAYRIALECLLLALEAGNGMLDPQDVHVGPSLFLAIASRW